MLKKILIVILAIGLIIAGIFLFTYKPQGETTETDSVDIDNFFPSGEGEASTEGGAVGESGTDSNTLPTSQIPRLQQISKNPTSGAGIVRLTGGDVVRFIDKATGHIFETSLEKVSLAKISNTTIPKIYESVWTENGSGVIIRYLKEDKVTIESFYAKLKSATSTNTEDGVNPQTLEGSFLPQNIQTLAVSPQQTKIFFLTETVGGSVGIETNPDGTKRNEIIKSPLKEFIVSWPSSNTLALTTKASFEERGILYLLNRTTLSLEKSLAATALTTLVAPDAVRVLYTENIGGLTQTAIFDSKTKRTASFPLQTLPEKCVWSRTEKDVVYCAVPKESLFGNLPDTWYQGKVSFSDEMWKVDLESGVTTLLTNPTTEARQDIDMTNLVLSVNEDYIVFTNKKDDSLWRVRINSAEEN